MFRFSIRELVLVTLVVGLALGWWLDRERMAAPLARLAEYQAAEQRELARQQAEKKFRDLEMALHAARAVNEYGVPKPASQRTNDEKKELERLEREFVREIERREQENK